MTTPAPPVDPGNHLLGETPANLTTAIVPAPDGTQRLALTVRTASTTLTVLLNGADAKAWAENVTGAAARMSATGLIVANGNLPHP